MPPPVKPMPRPTAPLTPLQPKAPASTPPKEEAPVLVSCCLGQTTAGLHAAAILRTQGPTVLECVLLTPPSKDAMAAEEAWRDGAYRVLYLGEKPRAVPGPPLVSGVALGLHKPDMQTAAVRLVLEDGKVEAPGEDKEGSRVLYKGTKLAAWEELDHHAAHHVLRASLQERRRKVSGG